MTLKEQLLKLVDRRFLLTVVSIIVFDMYARSCKIPGVSGFSDVQYVLGIGGIISAYLIQRAYTKT